MKHDAFLRALKTVNRRRPFRAYTIEFHSGDRVDIPHPEAVFSSGSLFLIARPDYSNRLFDAESVCQIIHHAPKNAGAAS